MALLLDNLDTFPEDLYHVDLKDLPKVLPHTTLIKLDGERGDPLFVSCLIHGNESSGFYTIRNVMQKYARGKKRLPRPMYLLFGNIDAVVANERYLDHQLDYNRIWQAGNREEHNLAEAIKAEVNFASCLASIDLHNNSGRNPCYSCVARLEERQFNFTARFSQIIVHFDKPDTTLTAMASQFIPAATFELGLPGDPYGIHKGSKFIEHCLESDSVSNDSGRPYRVYESEGLIILDDDLKFAFPGSETKDTEIIFRDDLDVFNFQKVPKGTEFGTVVAGSKDILDKISGPKIFEINGNKLITSVDTIPAMLTADPKIARQDCLGYAMSELSLAATSKASFS